MTQTHTHTPQPKFKGQSVQKIERKQTDGQTHGIDCFAFLTNAVGNVKPPPHVSLSMQAVALFCFQCSTKSNDEMAAWRSDNDVGRINEVTLRRAQLVLGWVTVFGRAYHLCM